MAYKVLVAVDLSHAGRLDAMFSQLGQMTGKTDTSIVLAHVIAEIPAYITAQLPPNIGEDAGKEAATALHALADEHGVSEHATVRVEYGNAAHKLLDMAREEDADLIVVGSHQPGPADYLLGSVAGKIVRHAKCSVLVVR